MSIQYTPKNFLRQSQVSSLQKYFTDKKFLLDFNWDEKPQPTVDAIFAAWHALPKSDWEAVERDFRDIYTLADVDGVRTIIEEGQYHSIELGAVLEPIEGYVDKIFHVFLEHRNIFDVASCFNHADNLNGRCWQKRKDLPKKKPIVSRDVLDNFGKAISQYLQETQGRGANCHVDTYYRGRKLNYFFAYPEDYTDTYIGYDKTGELERRPQNPAFEIIFVYDEIAGTMELFAQGDKTLKQTLQRIFVEQILNEKFALENPKAVPYALDALKNKDFSFAVDVADGIQNVRIRSMTVSPKGDWKRRITFDVGPITSKNATTKDIYDAMKTALNDQTSPLSQLTVKSAVIQVQFANPTGKGRAKTVNFKIAIPNSCNLKDTEEELKVKKYLKAWTLENA